MSTYIDRTGDDKKKSITNKQRFVKRIRKQLKKSLPKVMNNNSIEDLTNPNGKVKIPIKGIKEPHFEYEPGTGSDNYIYPGNEKYKEGDKIRKPQKGGGSGRKGSKDGDISDDDFVISISKEDFMEIFFEDLELPDMIKNHLEKIVNWKYKRAGYKNFGNPSNINLTQSYKKSLSRRMAVRGSYSIAIEELQKELSSCTDDERKEEILLEIDRLEKLLNIIPFMDDMDLKYNNYEKQPIPTTQAVVFCVMDISGSMTEHHKDLAKRFFMLLYLFLTKEYEHIEIVYIRHHTQAKEVEEKEFFESRETGGTEVFPALELTAEIYRERYGDKWNSYLCQISDGDVWGGEDAEESKRILEKDILPNFQYGWYVEVGNDNRLGDLTDFYKQIENENFRMTRITQVNEIWDTFRDIFSTEK